MEFEISGRVFDGTDLFEKSTLRFDSESRLVTSFGERGSSIESPNAKKLEIPRVQDYTILPGLIDAHVHFFGAAGEGLMDWATTPGPLAALRSVSDLKHLLFSGFTAVRELGTKNGVFLAKAAEEEPLNLPRLSPALGLFPRRAAMTTPRTCRLKFLASSHRTRIFATAPGSPGRR